MENRIGFHGSLNPDQIMAVLKRTSTDIPNEALVFELGRASAIRENALPNRSVFQLKKTRERNNG